MIAYPDTSFLYAFYISQSNSAAAAYAAKATEPLYVTDLLLFEFRQSIRFQVWRHQAASTEGLDPKAATAALHQLQEDLANGIAILTPCSLREVIAHAEELSSRFTTTDGFRSFDILHVATALLLNAKTLLSFDRNQRKLATTAGLKVAPNY